MDDGDASELLKIEITFGEEPRVTLDDLIRMRHLLAEEGFGTYLRQALANLDARIATMREQEDQR